ncbi:DUF1292 domain-containing protein [Bittarella massiliensis (ex Durand et al. 2017)]|uniref:DUF1292 domain-containing protein n=1 Tax=Bittarella massiliensis (ex Durand et al. 2017) TaxID=1720313 RepID=UPI001AA1C4CF|nr:DUF1292 domain-containing protein [Bittarella massiliensis (ex Durand et al. 2017)]MBO1680289.1 DUF1292 domain-containing protein [Bittarella massiliensis (ex Durand et al. 2017)]
MAQDFEPLSAGSENEQETGEPYIVTMSDEDGCEHSFELVDSMEKDGVLYTALIPMYDQPQEMLESDGQLVIMKSEEDEGEEAVFTPIQNDEEFGEIAQIFIERLSDLYDIEEEE